MKQKITKSDTMIGPGTYEQNRNLTALYKYKPSSGFSSGSVRLFDIRKGAISNKYQIKQYQNQMRNLTGNENYKLLQNEDDEIEYIEDAVPGPGTYYNAAQTSSIKVQHQPEKLQFFGSSSTRFKDLEIAGRTIGPGDYELRQKLKNKGKVAFSAKNPRFNNGTISNGPIENPGPGTYDPKITLTNKNCQKGQFGINAKRFNINDDNVYIVSVQIIEKEVPGPGSYFEADAGRINELKYFEKGVKQNYYFIETKNPARDQFLQKIEGIPPVGNYELDYYNLSKKIEKQSEIDPDLIVQIEGLGFNSSQPRFKEPKNISNQNEEDDDDNSIIHQSSLNQMLLKPKQNNEGLGFLVKDERFKYKPKTVPGPGHYYDSHKNLWNKRTYNIEFTGIQ